MSIKEFPLYLFDHLTTDRSNEPLKTKQNPTESSYYNDFLNFKYPFNLEFDKDADNEDERVNCYTHHYYSKDRIRPTSSILPCSLDIDNENYFEFDLLADLDPEMSYYYASCKSERAKFFPKLFCRGTRGKCIYTIDRIWLTPIEFQHYSSSTAADWKRTIKIYKPSKSSHMPTKIIKDTIKTLLDQKIIKLHSYYCKCEICCSSNHSYYTSHNTNLLSTFFLNNQRDFFMIHPVVNDFNSIEFNMFSSFSEDFNFGSDGSLIPECILEDKLINSQKSKGINHFRQTISMSTQIDKDNEFNQPKYRVNQIKANVFDENEYFKMNIYERMTEAFLNISYGSSNLKTILVEKTNDDESFKLRDLYEVDFKDEKILAISASDLIRGECGVVTEKGIYLINEHRTPSNNNAQLATPIDPAFKSNNKWKNIAFGNSPRHFVYSDYSQMTLIDCRIKNKIAKDLLKMPCKYLNNDEIIYQTSKIKSNYMSHLVCCSKSLVVVDERFPNRPLLKWKHTSNSTINTLENFSVDSKTYDTNIAIFSNGEEVFLNQFSLKINETPISQNYPLKLESAFEFDKTILPFCDKMLKRFIQNKYKQSIVSLSTAKTKDSFALFQYQQNQNIFCQSFEICNDDNKKSSCQDENAFLKQWSKQLEKRILYDEISNLEIDFEDINLKEKTIKSTNKNKESIFKPPSQYCKICLNTDALSISHLKNQNQICKKCGLSISFSHKIFDNLAGYENSWTNNEKALYKLIEIDMKQMSNVWGSDSSDSRSNAEAEPDERIDMSSMYSQPMSKRYRANDYL